MLYVIAPRVYSFCVLILFRLMARTKPAEEVAESVAPAEEWVAPAEAEVAPAEKEGDEVMKAPTKKRMHRLKYSGERSMGAE